MIPSRLRRDGPLIGPPPRGRSDSGTVRTLAFLAAGVLVGACGGDPDSPPAPTVPPSRIVSLAPSHTELLFALGAGTQVVGVTRFCDRPPEARGRTVVGDAVSVSLEKVASLRPDLVVVNAEGTAAAVGPLGVRTLRVPTDTLENLLDAVGVLGRAVGREAEARQVERRMREGLARAREKAAGRPRTRVLLVIQRDPFVVAGGGSYAHSLLDALGAGNAAGDLPGAWPLVSAEAVLARAPECIVDASLGPDGAPSARTEEAAAYWRRFPGIPAVRDGRVRALADQAALRPGPSLEEALRALDASLAPPNEGTAKGAR